MKFQGAVNAVKKAVTSNSSVILSSVAIAGVVTTAYLTGKATMKAARELNEYQDIENQEFVEGYSLTNKEKAQKVWKFYIPAAASGAVTIGCIVGSTHISARRGAAAQAAFVLSERAFHEYRGAVVEQIGERKDKAIRDEIAEKKVKANPAPSTIIHGPGNILCCELYTGRYFTADVESLNRAVNAINAVMLKHDCASLSDMYDLLGLSHTQHSDEIGWRSDRLLEIETTFIGTEDGRPCLAFEYNYTKPLYGGN